MNDRRRRFGFGAVDAVMGLVCVTMLASLAMPALMQLRNKARLESCALQIREITLAAHNFYDAYRRLPPATLGFQEAVDAEQWTDRQESDVYWKHVQNTSSLLITAPFMELIDEYRHVNPVAMNMNSTLKEYNESAAAANIDWQGDIPGIEEIHQKIIDKLLCPEDDLRDHDVKAIIATQPCQPMESWEMGSLDTCNDIVVQYWPNEMEQLGLTNYVACLGVAGVSWSDDAEMNTWQGAMSPRQRVRFENITDGTSNTIMYGESLGEINDGERVSGMSWIWGGGARITGHWKYGPKEYPDDADIPMLGNEKYSSGVGFGSKHDGVIVLALCDGSVHPTSTDIDIETLYQLAGKADGNVVGDF